MKKYLLLIIIVAFCATSCRNENRGNRVIEKKTHRDRLILSGKLCPHCGNQHIAQIVYGLLFFDDNGMFLVPVRGTKDSMTVDSAISELFKNGELVAGGCVVRSKEKKFKCNRCNYSW